MTSSDLKFETLRSTNYSWRNDMRAALTLRELWDAVERGEEWEALTEQEQATMAGKAYALILICISPLSKLLLHHVNLPLLPGNCLRTPFAHALWGANLSCKDSFAA